MAPPKLYKTAADKKAAKKANYNRYYKKHKDSINHKCRSQYAQNEYLHSKIHSQQCVFYILRALIEVSRLSLRSKPKKDDTKASVFPGPFTISKSSSAMKNPDNLSEIKKSIMTVSPISQKDIPATPTLTLIVQKDVPTPALLPAFPIACSKTCKKVSKASLATPSIPKSPVCQRPSSCILMQHHSNTTGESLGLRLAKQSIEALYNSYVAGLGGSWPHFFDRLSTSFIDTDNSDEIDEAFDDNRWSVALMKKRFNLLQAEAVLVGDHLAIQEGRGMLERIEEVGEKLREFYWATLHGSEDFKEQVVAGHLVW
ncbi:hypothetical protein BT96DRAFT_996633 [Gymnopus androsaceus JB14]|uniref:Uncharacterized protein n=1 Tax=Gymnopus androsaceus JB14 TaxID=1447944 RepID=A0A6A4HFN0_9AGAR|nr:hypothetical protein BT96DRAFT_996633 [Gymnopus androsaceus JB14]